MDITMQITQETPSKLILEKTLSFRYIWEELGQTLIKPLLFLVISFPILYILKWPTWWYWVIAIVILLIETFLLFIILTTARKTIVSIDLYSKRATRVERLFIGIEKKQDLELEQINRVLIHSEEVGHHTRLLLDSENHPHLELDSALALPENVDALHAISIKIGEFLQKPVVGKHTDLGNLISEEVIHP